MLNRRTDQRVKNKKKAHASVFIEADAKDVPYPNIDCEYGEVIQLKSSHGILSQDEDGQLLISRE
jgi:hypothetical protein